MELNPKLDPTVSSSEIFPQNYLIHRRDRNIYGGGVFIATKEDLISVHLPQFETNCEATWVELDIQGNKLLHIGAFYRPPSSDPSTMDELDLSISKLRSAKQNSNIILCGDFNLPGIEWSSCSVRSGAQDTTSCTKLLDISTNYNLEQLVAEPTRGHNILDLCLTSIPGLTNKCYLGPGISDHDIVVVDTGLKARSNKKKPRSVSLYKKANWVNIEADLDSFNKSFF